MHAHPRTLTPDRIIARFKQSRQHDPRPIRIRAGTRADYATLSRLHYRAGSPATFARVFCAIDESSDELTGVMVISRPTLNGKWRSTAWPGRFDIGTKRQRATNINDQLRTISRVIIDPRYRGLGVARRLVRTYLDAPDTPCTEAIAAMGPLCPFFERAGMKPITISPMPRDIRLVCALEEHGLTPTDLLTLAKLPRSIQARLRTWAKQNASTRRIADGAIAPIARAAATRLIAPPTAYAHDTD